MDENKPTIIGAPASAEAAPTAPVASPTLSVVSPEATTPTPVDAPQADPVQFMTDGNTKSAKKRSLIVGLISFLAVLLIGGSAFAVVSNISSQPDNILKSSVGNLIGAQQVAIDGSLDISSSITSMVGISSVSLDFNSLSDKSSGSSSTTTLKIKFVDGTELSTLSLSEVMLVDGIFYVKLDGVKDLYGIYYDTIASYLTTSLEHEYERSRRYATCADNYDFKCYQEHASDAVEIDATAVTKAADYILSTISDIVDSVDGSWQRIAVDEVMASELAKSMDPIARQGIAASYKCSIDTIGNFTDYTEDFTRLYDEHPFVTITPAANSFYDISIGSDSLADYINSLSDIQFFQDLADCSGATTGIDSTTISITPDDISRTLTYFPTISAKFDGFLVHHLTNLRLTKNSDYYNLAADLHFTYPTDTTVSAPTDASPIMDLVQDITDTITTLTSTPRF